MAIECRSCRAPIRWVKTPAGKAAPLDAQPEKRYVISGDGKQGKIVDTYVSHFATCPDAKQHRLPIPDS